MCSRDGISLSTLGPAEDAGLEGDLDLGRLEGDVAVERVDVIVDEDDGGKRARPLAYAVMRGGRRRRSARREVIIDWIVPWVVLGLAAVIVW